MLTALAVCVPVACTPLPADLLAGRTFQYSIDDGQTFADQPPVLTEPDQVAELISTITFDVDRIDGIVELHLHANVLHDSPMTLSLNGTPIRRPYERMGYTVVPGISPESLKIGRNELVFVDTFRKYGEAEEALPPTSAKLVPMTAADLAIQTGPVLGAFDADRFSVTCRTNMIAEAVLRARPVDGGEEIVLVSQPGLMHEFVVPRATNVDAYAYRVEARLGEVIRTTAWRPAPRWPDVADGSLRFAVASDVQTASDVWPTLAADMAGHKPNLLVFTGDMVHNGRNDSEWDAQFLGPARNLLAVTPLYPVQGNHEMESPILDDLFYTAAPGGCGFVWAQQIGEVLLIAIDGLADYTPGTDNHAWLEKALAEADARFVFLFSHYPSYGSNRWGSLDDDGKPIDRKTRQGQTVLMPLLAKHGGTAMVTGHDHFYERTEPPSGVTAIICGGGGGTLDGRNGGWKHNNPHSKAYAARHHYLLFDVEGDSCTMKAIALNGEVIDTRTWQARPGPTGDR